jgi:uncharacterized protein DUF222/HNH endonuclease
LSVPPPRITRMEVAPHSPLNQIHRLELAMRALSARMLERVSELDEEWPDDPAVPDLACELAVRLGISARTAAERLRIARALRELPNIALAHAEGRMSLDQLRWVSRFATAETDRDWAGRASRMRPDALRLEFLRQQVVRRRDAERQHAGRSASMSWDEERKEFEFHANLGAEQGAAVEEALNSAAQHVATDEDADDRRGARLADAFHGLVTSSGPQSQRPTLVIHADAEVVAGTNDGSRHLSETSNGAQLSNEAVRRLACDARVLWALEKNGAPVGIASKGRVVTDHQMELLMFRDRGCTFPGCGSRWFLHAHHIQHWADGGKTSLENLTLLCGSHHRRLHKGDWTIRGRPPDSLEFLSPLARAG